MPGPGGHRWLAERSLADIGRDREVHCYRNRLVIGVQRFFNTAGPIEPELHYHVPPLPRVGFDRLLTLIRQRKYFVMHAPRQTGKTTAIRALRDELNATEEFRCVYVNVEGGQTAREDVGSAMRAILNALSSEARDTLGDTALADIWPEVLTTAGPHDALRDSLGQWSKATPKPLVLLIDEIDALIGDTLLAVLRQLRAGYPDRPLRFPQSVVLCGVRDVRDYRIRSSAEGAVIAGGSAFNIRAASLRLGDFTRDEVEFLLSQHTDETAQRFTDTARSAIWELTQGQPWLVNALAYETCFENQAGRDRKLPITPDAVQEAREQLILRRETHLDQLTDKLQEERVRRVIEPLLCGDSTVTNIAADDLEYVRDLGLIARAGPVAIANPIYREVIPRDLTYTTQEMAIHHDPQWFVGSDGALRVSDLLAAFQEFFRENSEHWAEPYAYKEAGPQLLLQAFLQRIVNSGGRLEREYGLGRMRTDLLIVWRLPKPAHETQKAVIECKILRNGIERTLRDGLAQTRAYMDRCSVVEGHLVIFDRTQGRLWDEKIYRREETVGGSPVTVWGM